MLPIIYLDMDGVFADFHSVMSEYRQTDEWCDIAFHNSVLDFKIFTKLPMLSNAHKLVAAVKKIQYVQVEFLTSTACRGNEEHHLQASIQKAYWLQKHNLYWKPNFVRSWEEKKNFADGRSILIDDGSEIVKSFSKAGGYGIEHDNDDVVYTIAKLHKTVSMIKETLNNGPL